MFKKLIRRFSANKKRHDWLMYDIENAFDHVEF